MKKKQLDNYFEKATYYVLHHKVAKKSPVRKKKTIPAPLHKYGYSEAQLKEFLTKKEMKQFEKWIAHQTVTWDDKKKCVIFYGWDVKRFVELVRSRTPTYWD